MNAVIANVVSILLRELLTLRREVDAYPTDADIWARPPGIVNSAGTLVLHLTGNLQHFMGCTLGGSHYVRDRPREFSARDLPRAELLRELDGAEAALRSVAAGLDDADPASPFPETVGNQQIEMSDFLIHMCAHLAYHLGQVDYHRRVVTGQTEGVNALPLTALRTARAVAV